MVDKGLADNTINKAEANHPNRMAVRDMLVKVNPKTVHNPNTAAITVMVMNCVVRKTVWLLLLLLFGKSGNMATTYPILAQHPTVLLTMT